MAGEPSLASSPSAAPHRSSPLSRPPVCASGRLGSPSRRLSDHAHPRAIPSHPHSHRHASQPFRHASPSPSPSSSLAPTPCSPSPPLSRSHPLLGSYQLSLLHSRMSRTQSHSLHSTAQKGFSLHIRAMVKGRCAPDLRCPTLDMPFSATYYDLPGSSGGVSPWVGQVDLEQRYFDQYAPAQATSDAGPSRPPPLHPGMEIAPVGQLQLLVRSVDAPIKVFIVPYDLRRLPVGGRLLVRERTVVRAAGSDALRYAVQLQFTCTAAVTAHGSTSATTRRSRLASSLPVGPPLTDTSDRAFFISKSIKVIFFAQPPNSTDETRVDRHDEVVCPPTSTPASSKRDEWDILRAKWLARQQLSPAMPFEKAPITPRAPLSLLAPIPSAVPSRDPSRPSTPTKEGFSRAASPAPAPAPAQTGRAPPRYRRTARPGSGSYEDKELSERLLALELER